MTKKTGLASIPWWPTCITVLPSKAQLQKDAGIPDPVTDLTYEARLAVSGQGPLAYTWEDKPHRIVYDLCREIERLSR
jgi:hypothetical protein